MNREVLVLSEQELKNITTLQAEMEKSRQIFHELIDMSIVLNNGWLRGVSSLGFSDEGLKKVREIVERIGKLANDGRANQTLITSYLATHGEVKSLPVNLLGRKMAYCLITYNVQSGEQAFTGQVVVAADMNNLTIEEAIHEEMMEFFGEGNTQHLNGSYYAKGEEYAVTVSKRSMLNETDASVLVQYLPYTTIIHKSSATPVEQVDNLCPDEFNFLFLLEDNQVGYAYSYENEDGLKVLNYQDRFDVGLLETKETWDNATNNNYGQQYISDVTTSLEALNAMLDFWTEPQVTEIPEFTRFESAKEAYDYALFHKLPWIIY